MPESESIEREFHPLAEALAQQWITDFWASNHEIKWMAVEEEVILWLDQHTALVGRVDARGQLATGDLFFGEWKSMSAYKARYINDEKAKWRRDPQALTYGVLLGDFFKRFTVRWALKTKPVQTNFEWYTYEEWEIEWWRNTLLDIARDIRLYRFSGKTPWFTNVGNCYRYGIKYQCPFLDTCPQDVYKAIGDPRTPHLEIEQLLRETNRDPQLVIIDASRVDDFLGCPEAYRRKWEGRGFTEENENLVIGKDFHHLIAQHLRELMKGNTP